MRAPARHLRGISTNGFEDALAALFGENAPGMSPSTIVRLKAVWEPEYEAWTRRPLGGKRYVYVWVDGVYVNVRLTGERTCILVVIGATAIGETVLLTVHDGVRESEESWKEVLLSLRDRGLIVRLTLASAGREASGPRATQRDSTRLHRVRYPPRRGANFMYS